MNAGTTETSDAAILELLRRSGMMSIAELTKATRVTPTAVRQRLRRLLKQGLISRQATRAGRGRPSHRYSLTEKGSRRTGGNSSDLALVLWKEIRAVNDPHVRRGLFERIAESLASMYEKDVQGSTPDERMQSVVSVFADRDVPLVVEHTAGLPVLTALACPYPELAQQDRGVCAMERMLFEKLVGSGVRLAECRLDGDPCCRFQTS